MGKYICLFLVIGLFSCTPNESEVIEKGKALVDGGKYEEAITYLDKAIKKLPNSDGLHNLKGVALIQLDRGEEAKEEFGKAYSLDSTNYKYAYNLGTVEFGLGNYVEAVNHFSKGIELNPDIPDIYLNRANAFQLLGQYQAAIKDYNHSLGLNPNNELCLLNLGVAYYEVDSLDVSKSIFIRILALNYKNDIANLMLGKTYLGLGEQDKACSYLKTAAFQENQEAKRLFEETCPKDTVSDGQ